MNCLKYLNSTLLAVVTFLITLSSCGKDPRTKAIEDLYNTTRTGQFYIKMVDANKERLQEEGSYDTQIEGAKKMAEEFKKNFDERFGSFKGMEVIDTVSTNDYKGIVYFVRFKHSKEDMEDYFLLEMDEEGQWKAKPSNATSFTTYSNIRKARQADAQAETDGFPAKGLWYAKIPDGGMIYLDFDSREKSFEYFNEKCNGFIVVDGEYGKQVNAIDNIKISGNTAEIKFVNFRDYNTYALTLTYDHSNRTITLDDLKLIEQNPDFNKYLIELPELPAKLIRDNGTYKYSTEMY